MFMRIPSVSRVVALFILVTPAAKAVTFFESFDSGVMPSGWAYEPGFHYGATDFSNGRLNAYHTNAGVGISRAVSVSASATQVVVSYVGNLAYSSLGDTNWMYVGLANGDLIMAQYGFGVWSSPGTSSAFLQVLHGPLGVATTSDDLAITHGIPRQYDTFAFTMTLQNGSVAYSATNSGGDSIFAQVASMPSLQLSNIVSTGLALYTTVDADIWADNYSFVDGSASVPEGMVTLLALTLPITGMLVRSRRQPSPTLPAL